MTYGVSRDEQGARTRDRKYVSECTAADVDAMKDIGTHTHTAKHCRAFRTSDFIAQIGPY